MTRPLNPSPYLDFLGAIIGVGLKQRQAKEGFRNSCLDIDSTLTDNAPMRNGLIVQGITLMGHCGVTLEERRQPQPLMVDLELECNPDEAIAKDDISKTVDYANITARIVQLGSSHHCALLETLADHLSRALLAEFAITTLHIWVRKTTPLLPEVTGSVGVRLTRNRYQSFTPDQLQDSPPARFLIERLSQLPKGEVLDIATGNGRNALFLAALGYSVTGIDRDEKTLATLSIMARERHLPNLTIHRVDLEANPAAPPDLGKDRYEGILVFFYLFRPLFPSLLTALKPGGVLMSETFLIDNHLRYQHPHRKEFCLAHNELLHLTKGLRVLHYDEGPRDGATADKPVFTARLLAQKPGAGSEANHLSYGSN